MSFRDPLNEKPLCRNIIYVQGIASPTGAPDARKIGNKMKAKKAIGKQGKHQRVDGRTDIFCSWITKDLMYAGLG